MRAKIASVQLDVYTHPMLDRRGRITATMTDGSVLPVTSASEEGEEAGAANIEFQWNGAIGLATEMHVPILTIDHDMIVRIREFHQNKEL